MNTYYAIQLMTYTLSAKVKKKIVNFRNLFDTAIGLRVLEMSFKRFQIQTFSGVGVPPNPPSASRLQRSLKFPVPLKVVPNNLSLVVHRLNILRCVSAQLAWPIVLTLIIWSRFLRYAPPLALTDCARQLLSNFWRLTEQLFPNLATSSNFWFFEQLLSNFVLIYLIRITKINLWSNF